MRRRKNDNDDDNGFAEWGGYMECKKSKLLEQFQEETNTHIQQKKSDIFNGISIFVNGYTDPSAEELKRIMSMHGGTYHHYESSKTTHIIASILPNVKIKQLTPNTKVVKPSWISESLAAGKLLDYKNYLLYTNESKTQPKLSTVIQNISLPKIQTTVESSRSAKTAVDPSFLSEFYNNSRLHLIATLGATFKKKITDLREISDFKFPAREQLKEYVRESGVGKMEVNGKIIMHIDMDCFFVSVGLLSRPELKGLPIAVTHASANQAGPERPERQIEFQMYRERLQKRMTAHSDFVHQDLDEMVEIESRVDGLDTNNSMSEIASCSYEARQLGIKNGMFLGTAMKLCPNLKTIPYDFEEYTRIAHILYDTICKYTLDIEAVSCDEMMVDCTELLQSCGASIDQWASYIRNEIKEATDCVCSAGFGSNRLQARLATRSAKPNGQYYLKPEDVEYYMWDIPVNSLPGVGRSLEYRLKQLNLKTCGQLQKMTLSKLQSTFGDRSGKSLFQNCRGQDDRTLTFEHIRKSVSAEVNYGIRFVNNDEVETFLKQLCGEVHNRLMDINMKGKCITLKLMVRAKDAPVQSSKFMGHGLCDNVTKSASLGVATNDLKIVEREILSIWSKLKLQPNELRGIGIQISRLEKPFKPKESSKSLKTLFQKQLDQPSTSTSNAIAGPSNEKDTEITPILGTDASKSPRNPFKRRPDQQNKSKKNENTQQLMKELFAKQTEAINPQSQFDQPINLETKNSSPSKKVGNIEKIRKGLFMAKNPTKAQPTIKKVFEDKPEAKIDTDVLKELPEDIRNEIMKEYNIPSISSTNFKESDIDETVLNVESTQETIPSIDPMVLNELPEDIRKEVIEDYKNNQTSIVISAEDERTSPILNRSNNLNRCSNNRSGSRSTVDFKKDKVWTAQELKTELIKRMTWKEIKMLLKQWMQEHKNPEIFDIEVFANLTYDMAIQRKIEVLYDFVKHFYRLVLNQENCEWHKAYLKIIDRMQEGMLLTYKSRLAASRKFNCDCSVT